MGKKKASTRKNHKQSFAESALPQNILPVGEHVEEDIHIYVSQGVYRQIHKFTKNKTTDESGGVLVGTVVEALGKTNLLIDAFVEAKHCEATPTTLTFTHESWEYIHKEIEKRHAGKKILGWIHTHPDFGIFLSEYDKFIHQNFFSAPTQVAYVIDPIQNIEGFYFWIHGKLEKCKGFFLYDKIGTKIDVQLPQEDEKTVGAKQRPCLWKNVALAVMSVALATLLVMNLSLCTQLEQMQLQQQKLENSAAQIIWQLQQQVTTLEEKIKTLEETLKQTTQTPDGGENDEPQSGDPAQ